MQKTRTYRPTVLLMTSLCFAAAPFESGRAYGQGCVAARGAGMPLNLGNMGLHLAEPLPPSTGFQAAAAYRWLHSDRHFVGDEEQVHRQREGSEVINDSHFVDLGITYAFTPRFSATLTLPFVVHDRSQVVRSNDVTRTILNRFHTQAAGIGDVRLEGNMWLLDPHQHTAGNVLIGLGVDAPTGEKDAEDTFQAFDSGTKRIVAQERTVDQSIQPGDGGWGITLDIYAYRQIIPRLNAFVNGAYTMTPEEKNGVPTFRSNPFEAEMSIPDTYMGRGGFEYVLWPKYGLTLSLAGRIEGVPVEDAVGGSHGFRRPGYAVSIEPGLAATIQSWSFGINTPVAIYRNREKSVADQQLEDATGNPQHGDAAFADFLVMFTVAKRF